MSPSPPNNPLILAKARTQAFFELLLTVQVGPWLAGEVSRCFKNTWVLAFARMSGFEWGFA